MVGEYQSVFRKGKLTLEHIFTLRQIISKFYEFNKELHIIFIDHKQVCDSIDRGKLFKEFEEIRYLDKVCKSNKRM